jgi:hypothetical protein
MGQSVASVAPYDPSRCCFLLAAASRKALMPNSSDTCPKCRKTSSPWVEFTSIDSRRSYYRYPACGHCCEVDHGPDVVDCQAARVTLTEPKRSPPWWAA